MKVNLCKNTKNVDKVEKYLDKNLKKVDIEVKGCIGMCKDCKKNVVAKVDGKEIVADSAYGLLKEIRKVLKKEEKLNLRKEEEMAKSKKKLKEELLDKAKGKDKAKAKEKAKDKEKAKGKEKSKDKEKAKGKEKSKDKAKAKDKEKGKDKDKKKAELIAEMMELIDIITEDIDIDTEDMDLDKEDIDSGNEDIKAKIVGDEIVLTVPTAQFSMDKMKISVNFGSFDDQNSTYEVIRVTPTDEAKAAHQEAKQITEKASVLTFKTPELLGESKIPKDDKTDL